MTKTREILEGKARILVTPAKKISKRMDVFYNPGMKLNRDIAVTLLNSLKLKKLRIADPLAGTGVRAIRFILELKKPVIERVDINDINPKAYALVKRNLKLNKFWENQKLRPKGRSMSLANKLNAIILMSGVFDTQKVYSLIKTKDRYPRHKMSRYTFCFNKKIKVHNEDANLFLMKSKGFDYIEIDPFGSPNPYLEFSVKRLSRGGILAVTATDTSALCGTSVNACLRKYWAFPLRNELMHETGLRILIRKIQLTGMQCDKALIPIFSHSTGHYTRAYLLCERSREMLNKIIKNQNFFLYCNKCFNRKVSDYNNERCSLCDNSFSFAGPLWTGQLWDKKLAGDMLETVYKDSKNSKETAKLLQTISQESTISAVGFYDANKICSKLKLKTPKKEEIIGGITKEGFYASGTHFSNVGIKSDIDIKGFVRVLKNS